MKARWSVVALAAALGFGAAEAIAQSGILERAVGGYTFEDAANEAPETKNFNSSDGKLTFAVVTHTAGNGFFARVGSRFTAERVHNCIEAATIAGGCTLSAAAPATTEQ